MSVTRIVVGVVVLSGIALAATGHGPPPKPAGPVPGVPEGFSEWESLIGTWTIKKRRFGFDGEVLEETAGRAAFSIAPGGHQILEHQVTVLDGRPLDTLHVFAYDPREEVVEIARTDSAHFRFSLMRGPITEDRIELRERHARPDAKVTRRVVYERSNEDRFVRRLDFSTDGGETWFERSEAAYERSR